MKITMMGTRGSIPTPSGNIMGTEFSTSKYGGNTTCVYVEGYDKSKHILDAGTGIRTLGLYLTNLKKTTGQPIDANLYISHTHWDHIQGFPFFGPAYDPSNKIRIYGEAKIEGDLVNAIKNHSDAGSRSGILKINGVGIEKVLDNQQEFRNFPAPLKVMKGIEEMYDILPGSGLAIPNTKLIVETAPVNHPGGCLSYKFTEIFDNQKKVFVYATDFEPDNNGYDEKLVRWFANADLVIMDGQYERGSAENPFMVGWGHSDYITDIDLAKAANVKKLIITHHEPKMGDKYHDNLEAKAKNYAGSSLEVELAKEGQTVIL